MNWGWMPGSSRQFRRLIHLDHGIILVTGPTGSGKTTTLYAALQEINAKQTEHHHPGRPDRVPPGGDQPDPDQREEGADVRHGACGTSSGRTPTSSWSARSATARPPAWPSSRP